MEVHHRPATPGDTQRLFELRRQSILALAPPEMSVAQSQSWAAAVTVRGMARKIRKMEIWIAECDHTIVAWGAIDGDRLEGLYTDPAYAGRGIGTALLGMLEASMRQRGAAVVRAEASSNAEAFYLRRGYQTIGIRTAEGARPIMKRL